METGERNVVCHVIRLNEITFEFQSALNPGNKDFGTFLERHGDAVKDIAFNCTDVDALILKVGLFTIKDKKAILYGTYIYKTVECLRQYEISDRQLSNCSFLKSRYQGPKWTSSLY